MEQKGEQNTQISACRVDSWEAGQEQSAISAQTQTRLLCKALSIWLVYLAIASTVLAAHFALVYTILSTGQASAHHALQLFMGFLADASIATEFQLLIGGMHWFFQLSLTAIQWLVLPVLQKTTTWQDHPVYYGWPLPALLVTPFFIPAGYLLYCIWLHRSGNWRDHEDYFTVSPLKRTYWIACVIFVFIRGQQFLMNVFEFTVRDLGYESSNFERYMLWGATFAVLFVLRLFGRVVPRALQIPAARCENVCSFLDVVSLSVLFTLYRLYFLRHKSMWFLVPAVFMNFVYDVLWSTLQSSWWLYDAGRSYAMEQPRSGRMSSRSLLNIVSLSSSSTSTYRQVVAKRSMYFLTRCTTYFLSLFYFVGFSILHSMYPQRFFPTINMSLSDQLTCAVVIGVAELCTMCFAWCRIIREAKNHGVCVGDAILRSLQDRSFLMAACIIPVYFLCTMTAGYTERHHSHH